MIAARPHCRPASPMLAPVESTARAAMVNGQVSLDLSVEATITGRSGWSAGPIWPPTSAT